MSVQNQQNDAQFEHEYLSSVDDWIESSAAYRVGDDERDYWVVQIPEEIRAWAKMEAAEEVDERDDRGETESSDHAHRGKCGEFAAAVAADTAGAEWEWYDGYEEGDLVIDGLRADIKSRVRNDDGHMDLLVGMRSRGDERDIQAEIYVQVLLSEDYSKALVSGWALNFEVQDARGFDLAQTHPSKIVMHSHLRDIGDLI
ncbi:hypothetical protein [Natronorubrum sp. DTA28]|uniref:hypothetical protein n=1 Tax=Natronorubrum sp. DTA28 TaxID=3447019 RepID=UPI003F82FBBA